MDHLGEVVRACDLPWDQNYGKSEVRNLKLVSRPKLTRSQIRRIFNLYDTDGSGAIDRNELQVLAYSLGEIWDNEKLDEVMREIDLDGGGDIDFDEFCHWFQNKEENLDDRSQMLSRTSGALLLQAKLLRRFWAGTLSRKFKQTLKRLPACKYAGGKPVCAMKVTVRTFALTTDLAVLQEV
jgi:hypothetical protein